MRPVPSPLPPVLFGAMLFLGSCSDPGATSPDTVLDLREEMRIGSLEDPATALNDVRAMVRLGDTLYLAEGNPPRIRRYAPDGSWMGDILATAGDGPGEVRSVSALGVTEDGLWVRDSRSDRLEVVTPDGEPVRSYRFTLAADSLSPPAEPLAPTPGGRVLAGPLSFGIGEVVMGRHLRRTFVLATGDGEVVERVVEAPFRPGDFFEGESSTGGRIMGGHLLPDGPMVDVFPDGSGLVVVRREEAGSPPAAFPVQVVAPDGTVEAEREVAYDPLPAGDWLDRILRARMAASGEDVPEPLFSRVRGDMEGLMAPRTHLPPVTRVTTGQDGSVWLRREEPPGDTARWSGFTRELEPVGTALLPAGAVVLNAVGGTLWVVEPDEMGVPFVVGYRMTGG